MPFASTATLRREIEARIPERPFTVEFWDGTRLAAHNEGHEQQLADAVTLEVELRAHA